MKNRTATIEELGLDDVPCGFEIKFYAADDPTDSDDMWWHVHNEKPIWNPEARCWETQSSDGMSYEIGTYGIGDEVPALLQGLTPEDSIIRVVSKSEEL